MEHRDSDCLVHKARKNVQIAGAHYRYQRQPLAVDECDTGSF